MLAIALLSPRARHSCPLQPLLWVPTMLSHIGHQPPLYCNFPFDPNSEWIPGKYPALRFNDGGHSNYNKNSTFWLHNVTYIRARTLELGYSLPDTFLEKINVSRARFYVNAYNLFSIDNLAEFGVDPEISDDNGLQYPQNKFVNVGVNISL